MCDHHEHVGSRPLKTKTKLRDKIERTFCFNSSSETFIHRDEHFSGAQLVCQGQSCWARQLSDCMCGRTAACIAAIVSCWLTAGWVGTENESFPSNMWARPSVSPPIWHWIPLRTAEETSGNLPALLEPSDGARSCWSGIKAPVSNQLALTLFTSEHLVDFPECFRDTNHT